MPNFFPRSCKLTLDFDSAQERGILVFARLRLVLRLLLPGLPLPERGGRESFFKKFGSLASLGWFSAVSFGSRVYRRCFAGAYPGDSVGRTRVVCSFSVRRGRVGVSNIQRWAMNSFLTRPAQTRLLHPESNPCWSPSSEDRSTGRGR